MTTLGTGTVYLVSAVVLICPYLCVSGGAAAAGMPSACDCHSGDDPCHAPAAQHSHQDSKSVPRHPSSRRGIGACLCCGAIIGRHVQVPDHGDSFVTCLTPYLDTRNLFGPRDGLPGDRSACNFHMAESGREVRALIASFLL